MVQLTDQDKEVAVSKSPSEADHSQDNIHFNKGKDGEVPDSIKGANRMDDSENRKSAYNSGGRLYRDQQPGRGEREGRRSDYRERGPRGDEEKYMERERINRERHQEYLKHKMQEKLQDGNRDQYRLYDSQENLKYGIRENARDGASENNKDVGSRYSESLSGSRDNSLERLRGLRRPPGSRDGSRERRRDADNASRSFYRVHPRPVSRNVAPPVGGGGHYNRPPLPPAKDFPGTTNRRDGETSKNRPSEGEEDQTNLNHMNNNTATPEQPQADVPGTPRSATNGDNEADESSKRNTQREGDGGEESQRQDGTANPRINRSGQGDSRYGGKSRGDRRDYPDGRYSDRGDGRFSNDYYSDGRGGRYGASGPPTYREEPGSRDGRYRGPNAGEYYRGALDDSRGGHRGDTAEDYRSMDGRVERRRRRDPVGEERAAALPPRPDSAASHRTSTSRATVPSSMHGYPGYGDPYGGKSARDAYDPQHYYYYYYSRYYDQNPKYRDYYNSMLKHYHQQYPLSQPPTSLPDERASVRSGRSSVNDEMKKSALNTSRASAAPEPLYDPYGLYQHQLQQQQQHHLETSSQFLGDFHDRSSLGGYEPSSIYQPIQDSLIRSPSGDVSGRGSVNHVSRMAAQRLTPTLFTRPHTIAQFTATGQIILLLPSDRSSSYNRRGSVDALDDADDDTGTIRIMDVKDVLANNEDVRQELTIIEAFPGPLTRHDTHKDVVVRFCESKRKSLLESCNAASSLDPRQEELLASQLLLWQYLGLLVRQNGKLCPADLAGLLVDSARERRKKRVKKLEVAASAEELDSQMDRLALDGQQQQQQDPDQEQRDDDCASEPSHHHLNSRQDRVGGGFRGSSRSLSSSTNRLSSMLLPGQQIPSTSNLHLTALRCLPQLSPEDLEEVNSRMSELVCLGRRREAIEVAVEHRLWGHAMAIGSRMEQAVGGRVLAAFLQTVASDDVMHTLVQQVNGKRPEVTKSYSVTRWGDWRRHLATLVANPSPQLGKDQAAMMALGDTLAGAGDIAAGHLCYLIGGGVSTWGQKLHLLGCGLSAEQILATPTFSDALQNIQCSEVYEYGLSLATADLNSTSMTGSTLASGVEHRLPGFQQHKLRYATTLAQYGYAQEAVRYCEVIAASISECPDQHPVDLIARLYHLASCLKYHHTHYQLGEGEPQDMPDPQWLASLQMVLYEQQQQMLLRQQQQQQESDVEGSSQVMAAVQDDNQIMQQSVANTESVYQTNYNGDVSSAVVLDATSGGEGIKADYGGEVVPAKSADRSDGASRASFHPQVDGSYDNSEHKPQHATMSGQYVNGTNAASEHSQQQSGLKQEVPEQLEDDSCDHNGDNGQQQFSFQPLLMPTGHESMGGESSGNSPRGYQPMMGFSASTDSYNKRGSLGEVGDGGSSLGGGQQPTPHFTPTHHPQQHQYDEYEEAAYTSLPAVLATDEGDEVATYDGDGGWGYTSLPPSGAAIASLQSPSHGLTTQQTGRKASPSRLSHCIRAREGTVLSFHDTLNTPSVRYSTGIHSISKPSDPRTHDIQADVVNNNPAHPAVDRLSASPAMPGNTRGVPLCHVVPQYQASLPANDPARKLSITSMASVRAIVNDATRRKVFIGDQRITSKTVNDSVSAGSQHPRSENTATADQLSDCVQTTHPSSEALDGVAALSKSYRIPGASSLMMRSMTDTAAVYSDLPGTPLVFGGSYPIDEPFSARHFEPSDGDTACLDYNRNAEDSEMFDHDSDSEDEEEAQHRDLDFGRRIDQGNTRKGNMFSESSFALSVTRPRTYQIDAVCCAPPNLCSEHLLKSPARDNFDQSTPVALPLPYAARVGALGRDQTDEKSNSVATQGRAVGDCMRSPYSSAHRGVFGGGPARPYLSYAVDAPVIESRREDSLKHQEGGAGSDPKVLQKQLSQGDTTVYSSCPNRNIELGQQRREAFEYDNYYIAEEGEQNEEEEQIEEEEVEYDEFGGDVYTYEDEDDDDDLGHESDLDFEAEVVDNVPITSPNCVTESYHLSETGTRQFPPMKGKNFDSTVDACRRRQSAVYQEVPLEQHESSLYGKSEGGVSSYAGLSTHHSSQAGTDGFSPNPATTLQHLDHGHPLQTSSADAFNPPRAPALYQFSATGPAMDFRSYAASEEQDEKQASSSVSLNVLPPDVLHLHHPMQIYPQQQQQQQLQQGNSQPQQQQSNNNNSSGVGGSDKQGNKSGGGGDSGKGGEGGTDKGFLSRIFGWKNNQAKLPDDKNPTIVWDEENKRWVNTDGTDDTDTPPPPPPTAAALPPISTISRAGPRRSRYVNPVDEKDRVKPSTTITPPLPIPSMMPPPTQPPMPQQQMQQQIPQQQMLQQMPQQQQMLQQMPQQHQMMQPQQPPNNFAVQQQPMPNAAVQEQPSEGPIEVVPDDGLRTAVGGRTRSDSSSIDLDDAGAPQDQDDPNAGAGQPMFFNPAQFQQQQQQQQQQQAGRGRGGRGGPANNIRRGRGGGPQRRSFQGGGAAPPPLPRA